MSTALDSLKLTPTESLPGLVSVDGPSLPEKIEEQYAIRQAADIGGINYVFFRRFSDGRSSQAVLHNYEAKPNFLAPDTSSPRLRNSPIPKIGHLSHE
jgi:hypothetical protein